MNTTIPRITKRKCHKCGKFLIIVDQKTETVPGQYGPVTTTTYHCSDPECQKTTDKDIIKMQIQKEEKEEANQKRMERITLSRKLAKEKKDQAKGIKV